LVTGGSSGIGESLVHRLATQGINVVVVALQNKLMDESMKRFKATYPSIQFRGVGCDLQDLKKRYNANWVLVTGGSSGIGESLVHRLASQGINVVVVALQNKLMD
jgi:short-subunit dehydrogenase